MSIDLAGRTLENPLTNAEITGYRSVLGQLFVVGAAVTARLVCWYVSGCQETEQGDAL